MQLCPIYEVHLEPIFQPFKKTTKAKEMEKDQSLAFGLFWPLNKGQETDFTSAKVRFSSDHDGNFSVLLNSRSEEDRKLIESVLWQIALRYNCQPPYGRVSIITKDPWPSMPKPFQDLGSDPDFEKLSIINFMYPKNWEHLCRYLSSLITSTSNDLPDLVILDENVVEKCPRRTSKLLTLMRELANRIRCTREPETKHKIQCIVALPKSASVDNVKLHFFANEVVKLLDDEKHDSQDLNGGQDFRLQNYTKKWEIVAAEI